MLLRHLMLVIFCWGAVTLSSAALSQEGESGNEPLMGPVIPDYGPVLMPPAGFYSLDPETHYKVSIDIGKTADFPGDRNLKLTSVARFLNMYAQQGIPQENIEFAVIVHGMAANDLLSDEAYQARFNDPNPNTELLDQLHGAGVTIYLCGQTAAFRNIGWGEIRPEVVIALSAMGAHVRLQHEGFTLIPF
ncbi:MAG: DsrE family protein [Luminiphilus sp.]|nr:DsrE family protein [Luminiphilus sp.]